MVYCCADTDILQAVRKYTTRGNYSSSKGISTFHSTEVLLFQTDASQVKAMLALQ